LSVSKRVGINSNAVSCKLVVSFVSIVWIKIKFGHNGMRYLYPVAFFHKASFYVRLLINMDGLTSEGSMAISWTNWWLPIFSYNNLQIQCWRPFVSKCSVTLNCEVFRRHAMSGHFVIFHFQLVQLCCGTSCICS